MLTLYGFDWIIWDRTYKEAYHERSKGHCILVYENRLQKKLEIHRQKKKQKESQAKPADYERRIILTGNL